LLVEGEVIVIYTPDVSYPWQLPSQARGELCGSTTEEDMMFLKLFLILPD